MSRASPTRSLSDLPELGYSSARNHDLERLNWRASIAFRAYGQRIGVRTTSPELLERVKACLPPCWTPLTMPEVDSLYSVVVGSATDVNTLYVGAHQVACATELDVLLEVLAGALQLRVAEAAQDQVFVHAGVVGWQGVAIVLPGRSFAGKSTLVATLVRAGATYFSDEYAVFDARGYVHPYARPIALRNNTGGQPSKSLVEVPGHLVADKPLPVGLTVFTGYRAGASWQPRLLSPGRALLALLAHSVQARRAPEMVLKTLREVIVNAPALESARGEASEMVEYLLAGCQYGTTQPIQYRA